MSQFVADKQTVKNINFVICEVIRLYNITHYSDNLLKIPNLIKDCVKEHDNLVAEIERLKQENRELKEEMEINLKEYKEELGTDLSKVIFLETLAENKRLKQENAELIIKSLEIATIAKEEIIDYDTGYDDGKLEAQQSCREENERLHQEAEKIPIMCGSVCKMGIDIKLIRREYKEGHKTYIYDIRRYENQQKNCPQICPRYKKEEIE